MLIKNVKYHNIDRFNINFYDQVLEDEAKELKKLDDVLNMLESEISSLSK